ncbi:MAG: serine/threonine protein kinase [Acidobacteria bacterium]|nr:serine/threonine protein kinase [Acidobacteriota bacterium]
MATRTLANELVLRSSAPPSALPLDFAERGVRRFGWLALGFALTQVLVLIMGANVQPGWVDPYSAPPIYRLGLVLAALLGSGFCALAWSQAIAAPLMLDLALVFEVLGGLGIAVAENAISWPGGTPIRGVSSLAVWIVFFVLAVPATSGKSLLASTSAALMGPVGLALNIAGGHVLNPAPSQWITLFLPTIAMAICASVVARFVYHLTGQVSKLRDLGSYHLTEELGAGGMGEIWIAEHALLARRVAIKLIRHEALQRGDIRAVKLRFEREAQAIASLSSPHTVELYDFGVTEEGTFYYVMELLEGMDLQRLVRDFGPMPAARVLHVTAQVCDSLAEAHAKGIVHRDIKPSNIVLSVQGCTYDYAKVLDFGLAKAVVVEDHEPLTKPGTTPGTPAFMAPESAIGLDSLDSQADVYSLGCVAYYLLTGGLVFSGKDELAMAVAHVNEIPAPPSTRTELPIPPELDELVLRCLAKEPTARPHGCHELATLLLQCGADRPWTQQDARSWWETNRPPVAHRSELRLRHRADAALSAPRQGQVES